MYKVKNALGKAFFRKGNGSVGRGSTKASLHYYITCDACPLLQPRQYTTLHLFYFATSLATAP